VEPDPPVDSRSEHPPSNTESTPPAASRLLVVDDDVSVRDILQDFLADCGYEVSLASNGPDAIELCRKRPPNLVLLDIRMPGMDGFEVCRILRDDPHTSGIPIILLSGLSEPEHKIRGFSLGVFHYVTKPFGTEELQARIESILGRQQLLQQALETSKRDTVRQLAVTLADRITNPLSGIMGCCQILSKNIDNRDKVIESVEMIKDTVDEIYSVLLLLTSSDHIRQVRYAQDIDMIDVEGPASDPPSSET